jgi:hypothetical protein
VNRGGSWNNDADNCRTANRDRNDPSNRNDNQGFRLARAPPPALDGAGDRTDRFPVAGSCIGGERIRERSPGVSSNSRNLRAIYASPAEKRCQDSFWALRKGVRTLFWVFRVG